MYCTLWTNDDAILPILCAILHIRYWRFSVDNTKIHFCTHIILSMTENLLPLERLRIKLCRRVLLLWKRRLTREDCRITLNYFIILQHKREKRAPCIHKHHGTWRRKTSVCILYALCFNFLLCHWDSSEYAVKTCEIEDNTNAIQHCVWSDCMGIPICSVLLYISVHPNFVLVSSNRTC